MDCVLCKLYLNKAGLNRYSEESLAWLGITNKDSNDNSTCFIESACLSPVLGA